MTKSGYINTIEPDQDPENFQKQVEVPPYSNNVETLQNMRKINKNKENSDFNLSNLDKKKNKVFFFFKIIIYFPYLFLIFLPLKFLLIFSFPIKM